MIFPSKRKKTKGKKCRFVSLFCRSLIFLVLQKDLVPLFRFSPKCGRSAIFACFAFFMLFRSAKQIMHLRLVHLRSHKMASEKILQCEVDVYPANLASTKNIRNFTYTEIKQLPIRGRLFGGTYVCF